MKNQYRKAQGITIKDRINIWNAIYPSIPPLPVHTFGDTQINDSFPCVLLRFLIASAKVQNNIVNPIMYRIRSFQVFTISRDLITRAMARIITIIQNIFNQLNFNIIPSEENILFLPCF